MTIPLSFRAAGATDLGTVRTNNEDAALLSERLVALADGMGGHAAGEVASAVVVDRLTTLVAPAAGDPAGPADEDGTSDAGALTREALTDALTRAKGELRALSAVDPSMTGMGTTLVALALTPEGVVLAHVGDSRLYRLRDGDLEQLTVDHTHVQRLVDAGRLAPEAVREHPFRSVILRSLDDTSDDLPDVSVTDAVAAGDRLLLCSDGLSDYVTDDAILGALAEGSPQEAADRLVALALDHATRDNVTVVVVDAATGGADDAGDAEPDAEVGGVDEPGEVGEPDPSVAGDGATATPLRLLGATLATADLGPEAREVLDAYDSDAVDAAPSVEESDVEAEPDEDEAAVDPGTGGVETEDADEASAASAMVPDAAPGTSSRATGLWLGLVVLTFLLTTGVVWLTQS